MTLSLCIKSLLFNDLKVYNLKILFRLNFYIEEIENDLIDRYVI